MIFSIQNITDTSEMMKIRDVELFVFPQFMRSLIQNRSYRDSVLDITCCVYSFCPEVLCHVSFLNHGASHFLQCPILHLYNSILLWSSRAGEIMGYAIGIKKILKVFIFKFPTMITSDFNNFTILLILHLGTEDRKHKM